MGIDTTKLPLADSDFNDLRSYDKVYVDKTRMIYELARSNAPIFLSRPRRFGKSLLVSTFDSLFSRGLEDFKGLEIENLWKEEKTYPVIRLECTGVSGRNYREIVRSFDNNLRVAAELAGFIYNEFSSLPLLDQFGRWLRILKKNRTRVVLLVDEYDAPLTKLLNNPELFEDVRKYLAMFYGLLKDNKGAFRFVFVTGIAKFQKASIFSEMNIFTDISLNTDYGTIVGYTQDELEKYFSPYLDNAAEVMRISRTELLQRMEKQYDGFCFDRQAKYRLYAPWSVLSFLTNPGQGLLNYWMSTGGAPTLLLEYIKDHEFLKPEEFGKRQETSIDELSDAYSYDDIQLIPLLTQTGYYTIESVVNDKVTLRYPNEEVFKSMGLLYTRVIYNFNDSKVAQAKDIGIAALKDKPEEVVKAIKRSFLNIPHGPHSVFYDEAAVQSHLVAFLAGGNWMVIGEKANLLGRADIVATIEGYTYVFELKFLRDKCQQPKESAEQLLDKAINQIKEKKYRLEFGTKKVYRIAMVFSEKERQFVKWRLLNAVGEPSSD